MTDGVNVLFSSLLVGCDVFKMIAPCIAKLPYLSRSAS